jgi:hypothetical protein
VAPRCAADPAQTLKKWLAHQPHARTIAALQAQLDDFAAHYNTQRPRPGIGRRTPATAYAAPPKAGPTRQGVLIDEHYRVRRDRIDRDGKLTIRHNSRLHHIGLGRRHAGTRVITLVHELDIHVLDENTGELLRALTLDPTRDYQRQTTPSPDPATAKPRRPQPRVKTGRRPPEGPPS